jgi:hypothetical protein
MDWNDLKYFLTIARLALPLTLGLATAGSTQADRELCAR